MIDQRELWYLFTLLDDQQVAVQKAVRDRLVELGEEAVKALRELSRNHHNRNADYVEDVVNEIRMTCTLRRLGATLENPGAIVDLEEGVFAIAKYGYPDIDVPSYKRKLDLMADDVRVLAGLRAAPIDRFMKIRSLLFTDLAFMGNRHDYYNPDNSFFNKVLDLRKGIPITLSVLMLLIGKRLNIALNGIGMPMHFLVQYDDGSRMFFVDAFNGGMIVTQDECKAMLASSGITFQPAMLNPVTDKDILERMWRNLYLSYQQIGNVEESGRVAEILRFIDPEFHVNSPSHDEDVDDEDDEDEEI